MSRVIHIGRAVLLTAVTAGLAAAQGSTSFGEGTHLVGSDIAPGIYRTEGEVTYFERLSGLSGEFGDIISNEASPEGPVLVEIKETDVAFRTEGSATWVLVDESYQPTRVSTFGAGWWLVGRDIQPGMYRTDGDVRYFARLSGLGGEFGDIISNEASAEGPIVVQIKDDDIAFQTQGSGVWELIDDSYSPTPQSTFGPGWWLVGRDIQPGLYRTEGEIRYFARLSGLSGEFEDIISNEASTQGPVIVEIAAGDVAFQTQGSGVWSRIDDSYSPTPRSSFGDGWWIVGVDILPGIYRTPDDVRYYARLSGFGHDFSDIIANAASEKGGSVIEIQPGDVGFETSGGAVWTLQGEAPTNMAAVSWAQVKASIYR